MVNTEKKEPVLNLFDICKSGKKNLKRLVDTLKISLIFSNTLFLLLKRTKLLKLQIIKMTYYMFNVIR
ncbi:hypothetical protein KUTeg_007426 [Tegillarca granosa]|uniref:Uncharacterized protein n=1 Tax=Tegillarca granosa TaxID=220873 RepID=A0ABQ9FD96_TEGGR|nr:hypothetical protein KUTeg_007426 [Tegillarca granosa]